MAIRSGSCLCALVALLACGERPAQRAETVFTLSPATWFEDGWSYYDVAPDGSAALFGARFAFRLIDLAQEREDTARLQRGLDQVRAAVFDHAGHLVRLGAVGDRAGWFTEGPEGPELLAIPAVALPVWSPDGARIAYSRPSGTGVVVEAADSAHYHELGASVTGTAWSPSGDALYTLALDADGSSSLYRLRPDDGTRDTLARRLDAPPRFNAIGVHPDGTALYLALASAAPPDDEARHRPDADRDTDIYGLDLATGRLARLVDDPGDDFRPQVIGRHLYWTHNDMRDEVVVVPAAGGGARVLIPDAQIPYWSHDGRRLAFTVGGWRIADWALNLDASVVNVDANAQVTSEPATLIAGYHEDFTPAWSPDGRWLAYHSHRSSGPVPSYAAQGSTDDIYLRPTGTPSREEIRLTDFGWEVGMADWAPDGRRLVFDSWERGGTPGVARPWIATIDAASGRLTNLERLATPEDIEGTLLAAWSPAGDEIAVVARAPDGKRALWVLAVDGSTADRLVEFASTTYGGLDWTPGGDKLIYAALAGERMQLFEVARAGGAPRRLTDDAVSLIHPQVSPDGRWIAATRVGRSKSLRRMPLPTVRRND